MFKKLIFILILSFVLAVIINRVYENYARPDALFFKESLRVSKIWEEKLRESEKPCYIFVGGSEARMTIDPHVMLMEHNVRAVNAAVQAGNGVRCNAQIGLSFLKSGDTLVLSYIPNNTNCHSGMTLQGLNFCYTVQDFRTLLNGILPLNRKTLTAWVNGSAQNYCLHLMRILTRPECIYRYSHPANARIVPGGRVEVFLDKSLGKAASMGRALVNIDECEMPGWGELISDLQEACKKRNVRLVLNMARSHASEVLRAQYAVYALYFTRLGVPVIKDPQLGTCDDESEFSDTSLHMSIDAGKRYSAFIAAQLKNEQYWREEELLEIIAQYP